MPTNNDQPGSPIPPLDKMPSDALMPIIPALHARNSSQLAEDMYASPVPSVVTLVWTRRNQVQFLLMVMLRM